MFRQFIMKVTSHRTEHSSRRKIADKTFATDQKEARIFLNRQRKIPPTMGLDCYSLLRIKKFIPITPKIRFYSKYSEHKIRIFYVTTAH